MAPTVNKDVEETRRLEKESRKNVRNECEILCVALMHEATNGKISGMMAMLDMISARVILEASEQLKMDYNDIIGLHFQHVTETVKILKERM